jgi:hypothetical protein
VNKSTFVSPSIQSLQLSCPTSLHDVRNTHIIHTLTYEGCILVATRTQLCCRGSAWWFQMFLWCIKQQPNMCDRLHRVMEQQPPQGTLQTGRNRGWGSSPLFFATYISCTCVHFKAILLMLSTRPQLADATVLGWYECHTMVSILISRGDGVCMAPDGALPQGVETTGKWLLLPMQHAPTATRMTQLSCVLDAQMPIQNEQHGFQRYSTGVHRSEIRGSFVPSLGSSRCAIAGVA